MTRLAVIADVHANYAALAAVLASAAAQGVAGFVFLGDYLTDCPYPERTLALLHEIRATCPTWMVRGNREDYLLSHRAREKSGEWTKGSGTGSLLYTYESLTEADLDFLETLPVTTRIEIDGCPAITACHASPFATKEWMVSCPERMHAALAAIPDRILLCGHTHKPGSFSFPEGRVIVCPSCGLPQGPGGNYLLLTEKNGRWTERVMTADYDLEGFIGEYESSPMPEYAPIWSYSVIRMLRERTAWTTQCVSLAYRYAKIDRYAKPMEAYWQSAAKTLGLVP